MTRSQWWQNFSLGTELHVAGSFIYNGLRQFHNLENLDQEEEVFETLYQLSVGFERLLKVAVVLLEHDDTVDQKRFEESLKTHFHHQLLDRIKKKYRVPFDRPHNGFLAMLGKFYDGCRYDRYLATSVAPVSREIKELETYLGAQQNLEIERGYFNKAIVVAPEMVV